MSHELQPDEGVVFPDKKEAHVDYERITAHIQEAAEIAHCADVGQERATWLIHPEYPTLPVMILYMTDVHYGSIGVDYELLQRHIQIVEETPNTYLIMGGDGIDNFGVKHAHAGIMGDAIPPQLQAQSFMDKLAQLDRHSKLGAVCFGNHEDWSGLSGYDYYQTWMRDLQAPIFSRGGVLHLMHTGQEYRVGITHKFWGTSKINITNAPKRALEFGYPEAEVMLVGDDHQSSAEHFDRGGKRMLVIDGGTYKTKDPTGKKWGLGPAGGPGYSLFFWPDRHKFEVYHDTENAKQTMDALVFLHKKKTKR